MGSAHYVLAGIYSNSACIYQEAFSLTKVQESVRVIAQSQHPVDRLTESCTAKTGRSVQRGAGEIFMSVQACVEVACYGGAVYSMQMYGGVNVGIGRQRTNLDL